MVGVAEAGKTADEDVGLGWVGDCLVMHFPERYNGKTKKSTFHT